MLIHQSELLQNNTVVVQGRDGVPPGDAGITGAEMACLAHDYRVLLAGDMLSDVFVPMLDDTDHPIEDYLVGLGLLEGVAGDVDVLVPGHGSVARDEEVRGIHEGQARDLARRSTRRDACPENCFRHNTPLSVSVSALPLKGEDGFGDDAHAVGSDAGSAEEVLGL
ncbi:hypothetical protein [Streptomyces sp. YIM 103828]|uniref:hypothetical protein n=1 Tax=Streptomyces sp. YIM 103828 TaxID=3158968 RepID=UPI0032D93E2F